METTPFRGSDVLASDLMGIVERRQSFTDDDWDTRSSEPVDPATGTVVIVGRGLDRVLVPWGEKGHEFWGLNDQPSSPGFAPVKCYTRWFQLHPPHYLRVHYPRGIGDLAHQWSDSHGLPLYMDRHYDEYPDSVAYPKKEVEALTPRGWYHCSSFDWMVALAIHQKWKRIALYGTDFYTFPTIMNGEPLAARACLEYWLGVAEGRGIEVEVHQRGDLFRNIHVACFRSRLQYGFEREPALDLTLDEDHWNDIR